MTIVYIKIKQQKKPLKLKNTIIELISEFRKVTSFKVSTLKSIEYINNKILEFKFKVPFIIALMIIKYIALNPTKYIY